ncbi:MAG TPA: pirin family protein [Bacteroidia bacterium]|nr:pirin family protein [Bacteroidia bacterium]
MPEIVIDARNALIGPQMSVSRILPFRKRRMVGPFIFMDHAGPVNIRGDIHHQMDVLPHPHIGLSTVTYLFNGEVTHRDSLGVEQVIKPGEVNWMTAGKGIAHSERFENPAVLAGGQLEMLQTWVALPEKDEECDPGFRNHKQHELPEVTDNGLWMRLIAGEAFGVKSNVSTFSPLFYLHITLKARSATALPANYSERAIYIVKGSVEVANTVYTARQMVVFKKEEQPIITAREDTVLMMLGGEPVGEKHIWWNFVSSRKERIEQAKADWKEGRIQLPPLDDDEFIPLPEDRQGPPPEALS